MADQADYPSPHSATPPLVGRDRELATLRDALGAALAGHGSLVLVGGEAGIGKTALAETALAEATQQGALVLVGRCYDLAETPPYGPWAEAFARPPHSEGLSEPPDLAGVSTTSQGALFAQVRDFLTSLAAHRPLVVLLDDLHWADQGSLDLLRALGRQLARVPILLVVTYRSDEVTRRHPLYALLPTLEREARAIRLDLRPLGEAALHVLVGRYALPGGDAVRLVAWLLARAEGSPFFTAQLLRTLEDGGMLLQSNGGWVLGDFGRVGLPAPLRQVLDARLARLGEENVRLLALAAVIGQEVPLALWATVAGTDEDGLLDAIDAAVDAHLLAEVSDGAGVRFAHALIREALYEGTLALRRRRLHRQVGEALLDAPRPDPDAVAYHLGRAGDPRATEWLMRAGERAMRAYAWQTASERYEAALALLGDDTASAGERARLLMTLAQLGRYHTPQQSVEILEEATRLATEAGDATLAAAARFDQGHLRCMTGDMGRGIAAMGAALPDLEALAPAERERLPAPAILGATVEEPYHRGALLHFLALGGRFAQARALGEPIETGAATPSARALTGLAQAYAALGEPARARAAYNAAADHYRAAGQHNEVYGVLDSELRHVAVPYLADRPTELARLATEWERAMERTHEESRANAFRSGLSLLWLAGRWAELRPLALQPYAANPRGGFAVTLIRLLLHQGETGEAWAIAREMMRGRGPAGPDAAPGEGPFLMQQEVQRVVAEVACAREDLPTMRAWLEAHDRWLAWSGAILGKSEGQARWAQYHRAAGDVAAAREAAERALAHATEPRQPLALLAAHRLIGELRTAEGGHDDAAPHLDAALAMAAACAAPYERALTLLAQAELRAAARDRDGADTALTEARALLEPLQARPALARADALASRLVGQPTRAPAPTALPFGLTGREAEVLRRVAQGLSDAEVAERLFLSPYTVKAHLRSVYSKLGVENRAAASRLAAEHGLA